MYVTSYIR